MEWASPLSLALRSLLGQERVLAHHPPRSSRPMFRSRIRIATCKPSLLVSIAVVRKAGLWLASIIVSLMMFMGALGILYKTNSDPNVDFDILFCQSDIQTTAVKQPNNSTTKNSQEHWTISILLADSLAVRSTLRLDNFPKNRQQQHPNSTPKKTSQNGYPQLPPEAAHPRYRIRAHPRRSRCQRCSSFHVQRAEDTSDHHGFRFCKFDRYSFSLTLA